MKELSHTDQHGKAVMIDVSEKPVMKRIAKARGHIKLAEETIRLVNENQLKKGDVFAVSRIAGISAAKQTHSLIPLCHNIAIDSIRIDLFADKNGISAVSEVISTGRTGVEMEAMTAAAVALLTVYDMCKSVDKSMGIDNLELIEKIKK